jgi:hypothetical protein
MLEGNNSYGDLNDHALIGLSSKIDHYKFQSFHRAETSAHVGKARAQNVEC